MSDGMSEFLTTTMELKTLRRAGWVRCGVEPCESVAEHTFGVALLALLLPKVAGLAMNRERCVALSLVHDLAESIVGDLTPHDAVGADNKSRREREAMARLAATLPAPAREELISLWDEFESAQTAEAKFVRDLDVLEMAWQAKAYREVGKLSPKSAEEFISSARMRLRTPAGVAVFGQIIGVTPPQD